MNDQAGLFTVITTAFSIVIASLVAVSHVTPEAEFAPGDYSDLMQHPGHLAYSDNFGADPR